MTVWGSESGLTFSKWTVFKNMYNTLHSNVLILPHKFPMITCLKHSESFSWDIIIYKDLPFCCEKGPCMFKKCTVHATGSPLKCFCGCCGLHHHQDRV